MAQLVIAAAGAVVGSFVGAPQLGFAIGSAIGGALFAPTQKQQGPRLSDLRVSGTETGQPIPYFEGKFRTAGQIAWASDRREIATTTEQGKGGPSVESTTYTYEVDMLYLLSDHEAETFARGFDNGKLVFNNLPDADIGSVVASSTTDRWRRITFYSGAADQLPDPTYEAAVGVGNAPAYRGRATIFIEGLQLGGNGQIPNLSFEVFRETTLADVNAVFASLERPNPVAFAQGAVYKDSAWYLYNTSGGSNVYTIQRSKRFGAFAFKRTVSLNTRTLFSDPVWVQTTASPRFVYYSVGGLALTDPIYIDAIDPETGVVTNVVTYVPLVNANVCIPKPRHVAYDAIKKVYVIAPNGGLGVDEEAPFIFASVGGSEFTRCATITGLWALAAHDGYIYALVNNSGWAVRRYDYAGVYVDEVLDTLGAFNGSDTIPNGQWIRVDADGQCWAFSNHHGRLFKITTTFEEVSTPSNTDTFNTNTLHGVFYCTEQYVAFGFDQVGSGPFTLNYNFRRFKTPTAVQPSLQTVVERLCARAGLDSAQYDASALSTITRPVRSMAVSQVTPIRQVMETLASSFFFGCSLSDKLYFRPRGGTSVATIPYEDLGAGEGDAQAEPLEIKVANQLEVPAQIALTYSNVNGDYNVATEYSDRLLTDQTSTSAIQVPLGFTPSEAKGIAETLIADASAGVFSTTVSLMGGYARLEPTDVVSVVDADGSSYRMRVTKKTESGPVISLDLVADDASVLTSAGITSDEYTSSTTVASPAETILRLLDIPILRDADDPLGIYAGFAGESTPWPGAALFKSPDDSTYERRQTVTDAAGMGATSTALTTWAGGFVFDETSTVTVLMDSGTLSSYTRDQIFDGIAPAYLIGSEIVYARSASLIAADTYLLSGFLRGMRGTEWAMSGHAVGEDVTVLSASGLRREAMDTSEIGAVRYFKAPTLGRALSTAEEESITLAAVGKKPFAPVNLRRSTSSSDPLYLSTSLLLLGEGANGSTVFTDSGPANRSMTVVGGAQISTAQFRYGSASMLFNGTNSGLTAATNAAFQFPGDLTIEAWIYVTPASIASGNCFIFACEATVATATGFFFQQINATLNLAFGGSYRITTPSILTANTWTHVALTREAGVFRIWVNGVQSGSSFSNSTNFTDGRCGVGKSAYSSAAYFDGYMDEFRITKGASRYSSTFTPPGSFGSVLSDSSTFAWDRRTRFAKNFTNGYVPLGESVESYEVDVFSDASYTSLKRTLTSISESAIYSNAQQVADFGSVQTAFYVDVYQLSAVVGRGYRLRGAV